MSQFDAFARYYDLDTSDQTGDVQFYLDFARRTGGPILELACGTGRLLVPLATHGYEVTGLDISPAMLDIARQKLAKAKPRGTYEVVEGDARQFKLGRTFSLAFIALNSFMHFVDDEDPERVLRCIHQHQVAGGLLILDLPNPDPTLLGENAGLLVHEWTRPGGMPGSVVLKFRSQRVDTTRQVLDLLFLYDEVAQDGQLRRNAVPFVLRYFHSRELDLLLYRCGYEIAATYGSYDLDPFDASREKMIYVARRR